MYMKKCGMNERSGLSCNSFSAFKSCLSMAYCGVCDCNFCASPRPDETAGFLGPKCFEVHSHGCVGSVPKFPRMRCADMNWSLLGTDGKMQDSSVAIVRKVLEEKLKLDGKWKKSFRGLKKAQLVAKVVKFAQKRNLHEKVGGTEILAASDVRMLLQGCSSLPVRVLAFLACLLLASIF
jgi:hypothetical protein